MLKVTSFAVAMTIAASTAAAFDWEAPPMGRTIDAMQAERSVAVDRATLRLNSTEAQLGSDIVSAVPIILAIKTGTHSGIDMAAAYAIKHGGMSSVQQAQSEYTGS